MSSTAQLESKACREAPENKRGGTDEASCHRASGKVSGGERGQEIDLGEGLSETRDWMENGGNRRECGVSRGERH